jgi:hypothetical protein
MGLFSTLPHRNTHKTGGRDALTPADIGALGLSASSYIIARPGDDLAAKYTEAKALTPNGAAKSATNRAALVVMPGPYSLSGTLTLDAEFVDVIGLGAAFQTPEVRFNFSGPGFLSVTANDIRVIGIGTGSQIQPANSKPLQVYENCRCTSGFGRRGEVSGTFIGCVADYWSFGTCAADTGSRPIASGTFIRCKSGDFSFGSGGLASGKFIDCEGGYGSFGGDGGAYDSMGEASGEFVNCKAGEASFGVNGAYLTNPGASGTFTNCTAGEVSFGSYSHSSGTFKNCSGGIFSFFGDSGYYAAAGQYINCQTNSRFNLTTPPSSAISSSAGSNQIVIGSTANPGTSFVGPSRVQDGERVVFSNLVGGAPLQNGVQYYASVAYGLDGSRFYVRATNNPDGPTIGLSTNITSGRVRRLALQVNCTDPSGNMFEGEI